MRRHESEDQLDGLWSNDDELGQLVRWSFVHSLGDAEPSPEVWHTILERVREQHAPGTAQDPSGRSLAPLAALVQATVIGCVLVTLGLGVRRDVIVARSHYAARSAPPAEAADMAQTMPSEAADAIMLAPADEELPARVGGVVREATLPG
jgi:hypothetical protein